MKAIKFFLARLAYGIVGLIFLAISVAITYIVMFMIIPDIFAVLVYAFFLTRSGVFFVFVFLCAIYYIGRWTDKMEAEQGG